MKLIGKGAFTQAFLQDSGKVLLKSVDPIKECMALGWFPDSYMFPTIKRIDHEEYEMEYFERPRSLKNNLSSRQWRFYKALREISKQLFYNIFSRCHSLDLLREAIDSLPSEFRNEKEVLHEAVDGCCNYGTDIVFEISPRNVAVKNKKLILLDCFFMRSKLAEIRSK